MTIQVDGRPARDIAPAGTERIETVIIGAGQAGLAAGHHLARRGRPFVILEAHERVGDIWRRRFDSLRLYTPVRYNGLPGMRFPGEPWSFPTKDEVGDFLEAYASRFELPVRTGAPVDEVTREEGGYVVRSGDLRFEADNVVVATGAWQSPVSPAFAPELDPGIVQMHSADYLGPRQLQPGAVLVVGAAHSGADVAHEVALAGHPTILAGRIHGQVPFRIDGPIAHVALRIMWFAANHVLTVRTPVGRKVARRIRGGGGGPLVRVKRADLEAAGVEHVALRVAGVTGGKPRLEDGRVLDVANVIWCTGFGKDLGWLDMQVAGEDGWPEQRGGAATSAPGLYFVGLPFQTAGGSMLIGGVGRDAKGVARRIAKR